MKFYGQCQELLQHHHTRPSESFYVTLPFVEICIPDLTILDMTCTLDYTAGVW